MAFSKSQMRKDAALHLKLRIRALKGIGKQTQDVEKRLKRNTDG